MLTDTVRPQTDAEAWQFRNRVEALTQSIEEAKPETRLAACACMIVFALLLVAGAIALKSPLWWLEGTTPILIALVVFNLAIAYSPKSRYERLVEPFRKQTAEDAETGKVRSIRVQAVRVLVRQWPLDGIHCLIFDGGKDDTLPSSANSSQKPIDSLRPTSKFSWGPAMEPFLRSFIEARNSSRWSMYRVRTSPSDHCPTNHSRSSKRLKTRRSHS